MNAHYHGDHKYHDFDKDFGVRAMPSSYLVDRQGVIHHQHVGFRPEEAERFRARAEQLKKSHPFLTLTLPSPKGRGLAV